MHFALCIFLNFKLLSILAFSMYSVYMYENVIIRINKDDKIHLYRQSCQACRSTDLNILC